MACHQLLHCQIQSLWRTVFHLGSKLRSSHFRRLHPIYPLSTSLDKGYCRVSQPIYAKNIDTDQVLRRDGLFDSPHTEIRSTNIDPSNGKLMLIDGTSIIYRAYYRLLESTYSHPSGWPSGLGLGLPCWRSQVRNPLPAKARAKLHHGHLSHADGNGDWVLTIFTALSLIIDVLEFLPSHIAVVFDHDGKSCYCSISFSLTTLSMLSLCV
ncbi:hypothetical protein MTR67_012837 [Solanum verrucosum]|uniref:5'-3' exonuclease alpha-helical arch N-terminal domain-containing protein n=1 Tax=Solanum verrucosum TaxID=315347 RepID=A0AAF0Q9F7_SOLVR|nr:hypothetical protein MTR67_012837 [Solanum verrucosum]